MCKSLERLAQEELESYMATEIGLSFSHRKSETADSNKLGEAICLTCRGSEFHVFMVLKKKLLANCDREEEIGSFEPLL